MVKETIKYKDYNGVERTETFMFDLNEPEVIEMELSNGGSLTEYIQTIVDAKDQASIIKVFKDLLLKAYGVKSEDGKFFEKSEELSKKFSQCPAYSILFMQLATDDAKAAAFVNGIIPKREEEKQPSLAVIPDNRR